MPPDSTGISTRRTEEDQPTLPVLRVALNVGGVLLILGVTIAVFTVMTAKHESHQTNAPAKVVPKVRVLAVQPQAITLDFEGYGTVRAVRQFTLAPQVAGRVMHIHPDFEAGRFVKQDTILVEIDPTDYEIGLQQRKADVLQTAARIEEIHQQRKNLESEIQVFRETMVMSENEFKRTEKAWKENPEAITVNVRDQTEGKFLRDKQALILKQSALALNASNLKTAEAQRAVAEAALHKAEVDLSRTKLRTPFDGRILTRMVEQGQFVTTFPATGVGSVASLDAYEIPVAVEPEILDLLDALPSSLPREGSTSAQSADGKATPVATVQWLAHKGPHRWKARLVRIEPLNESNRTIPLIVEVRDPWAPDEAGRPPLPTGAYCKVTLTGQNVPGAILIPERAVHEGQKVYVALNGKLHIRDVSIRHRMNGQVVIDDGLAEGEALIVSPVAYPVEGMSVEALPLEETSPAGVAAP